MIYIEKMGHAIPPAGNHVKIKYMEGCQFLIVWLNCPDLENVIELHIPSRLKAIELANEHGWIIEN